MVTINLAGPEGNAISLLATVNKLGKQLEFNRDKIQTIQDDMMSGDYDNLISIFKENFGHVIDVIDPDDQGEWTELEIDDKEEIEV